MELLVVASGVVLDQVIQLSEHGKLLSGCFIPSVELSDTCQAKHSIQAFESILSDESPA